MKIIIFDTEYLSLSKKYSDFKSVKKFKQKLFPEIIQISFLKFKNIHLSNKRKKLNLLIKIKQKIPKRITRLTNISSSKLEKKGKYLNQSIGLIDKFIDQKSILIANGDDIKLLKLNIKFNNIQRKNKKILNFVNLRKILNELDDKKNYDTENLIKIFKLRNNLQKHNASNDCIILYNCIRKIIKIYGKKKFKDLVMQNKKLVKI